MLPSGSEILLILVAAFILFGGRQVRDFMRTMGQIARKIQNAARDFQRELNSNAPDEEEKRDQQDLKG